MHSEIDELSGRCLLNEQISEQRLARADDERKLIETQVRELEEKLDRKEYQLQIKEKRWIEVESILKGYVAEDAELEEKLREMKMTIASLDSLKITTVVCENEALKADLARAYRQVDLLRAKIVDPVFRLRLYAGSGALNEYMLGKPRAR